jgi:hypothetical protein
VGEKREIIEGSVGFKGEGVAGAIAARERAGEVGVVGTCSRKKWPEVEGDPDRWVPPVSGKEKQKKREKGKGCAGKACWAAAPGWPKGCPAFIFLLLFFFISYFVIYLENEIKSVWIWIFLNL